MKCKSYTVGLAGEGLQHMVMMAKVFSLGNICAQLLNPPAIGTGQRHDVGD